MIGLRIGRWILPLGRTWATTRRTATQIGKPGSQRERDKERQLQKFTGSITWFNGRKGFGFITREDGEKDVFVPFSAIAGGGDKAMADGQRVEFEMSSGAKGPSASKVAPI